MSVFGLFKPFIARFSAFSQIMDIGQKSVEFIQMCIETEYADLMELYAIDEMEWIELSADEVRAFATLLHSNIIALFPPLDISEFK